MNQPEYIVVDEMQTIVAAVKTALALPVLNYQYGEEEELMTTLNQWTLSKGTTADKSGDKFPLVWLFQPFEVDKKDPGAFYGRLTDGKIFIFAPSKMDYKAAERMTNVYKPTIYPIYRELLNQIILSGVFTGTGEQLGIGSIEHSVMDRYYFSAISEEIIGDVVDCSIIYDLELFISNNPNCSTFKNF
jgi:hypothetical protein